jgi:hypothetical protein
LPRRIDAVVDLPEPLHVESAALGSVIAVTIEGRQAKIALPNLPPEGLPGPGELSFLARPVLGRRQLPPLTLRGSHTERWGYASSAAGECFVESLRLRISIEVNGDTPQQMSALGGAFDAWLGTVRDWICAWTGQVRDRPRSRDHCHISTSFWVAGQRRLFGSGFKLRTVIAGEQAASREQMVAAMQLASAGRKLPLPHAILLRARSEAVSGEFRRAVIDACTSAEVALGDAVRKAMTDAGVPEKTMANALKQASGAVEMFRLFVITGARLTVSDSRVMDQLANPRNQAAHAGLASTAEEAKRAIDTATLIVDAAAQLPDPASATRAVRSRA